MACLPFHHPREIGAPRRSRTGTARWAAGFEPAASAGSARRAKLAPRAGFKPAAFRFVAGRSVRTELSGQKWRPGPDSNRRPRASEARALFGLSYRDNVAPRAGLEPALFRLGRGCMSSHADGANGFGAGSGIRTRVLDVGNVALHRTEPCPRRTGAPGRTRTGMVPLRRRVPLRLDHRRKTGGASRIRTCVALDGPISFPTNAV